MNNQPPSSFFSPIQLFSKISTGIIASVIHVIIPVSFAALIFSGRTSGYVAEGIGIFLLGSIGAGIISSLITSYSGTLTVLQNAPATVMALTAAALMTTLPQNTPSREVFLTIVASVAVSSLLTGLVCLFLGQFHLGGLIRYLPYPVIGGFMAGTGWLLVTGGVSLLAGQVVSLSNLAVFFQAGMLLRWLPGLLMGAAMVIALSRFNHPLTLPGIILGSVILFFVIARASGFSLSRLSAEGWLLGPLPSGALWRPSLLPNLALVHWGDVLGQWAGVLTVVLVSTVSFLLNISGIELAINRDLNLDRELTSVGLGNVVSGLVGGSVCFPSISTTVLNHRLGRDSRVAGWVVILICAITLFFGAAILNTLPRMVLGGMLSFVGLSFLDEWVLRAWSRFPLGEYFIILLILVVITVFGFLPGVVIGLLAAVGLFVVSYSQVNVAKHILSGLEYRSRVTRPLDQKQLLEKRGESIFILQLQGFLFFGTANQLFDLICQRVEQARQPEKTCLEYILLDFRQISGVDTTAVYSFFKMKRFAALHSIVLVFSHLSSQVTHTFDKAGLLHADETFYHFQDLDHAIEWCEDRILAARNDISLRRSLTLEEELQLILPNREQIQRLTHHFERLELQAGDYLIHQGEKPDEIFFIESGQVTAQLESRGKDPMRLETMQGGHVVGEIGFYLGIPRTAAVVADEASVVYRISHKTLQTIEEEDSASASIFHQIIARLLAERATHLIDSVNALQRT